VAAEGGALAVDRTVSPEVWMAAAAPATEAWERATAAGEVPGATILAHQAGRTGEAARAAAAAAMVVVAASAVAGMVGCTNMWPTGGAAKQWKVYPLLLKWPLHLVPKLGVGFQTWKT
jgi:hypothetical protein